MFLTNHFPTWRYGETFSIFSLFFMEFFSYPPPKELDSTEKIVNVTKHLTKSLFISEHLTKIISFFKKIPTYVCYLLDRTEYWLISCSQGKVGKWWWYKKWKWEEQRKEKRFVLPLVLPLHHIVFLGRVFAWDDPTRQKKRRNQHDMRPCDF